MHNAVETTIGNFIIIRELIDKEKRESGSIGRRRRRPTDVLLTFSVIISLDAKFVAFDS